MKSGIYKIDHKQYLRGGYHINPKLQNAWNKYGEDKFIFEVIEETDQKQEILFERENHYLSTLKSYKREIGYNICPKAEGGDNITYNPNRDKFIEKMRLINLGELNPMFGKKHTENTVGKMKTKSIGRYTLDWFIAKYGTEEGLNEFKKRNEMLKYRKINYSYDNGMKGKKRGPMSDEIKKRISERKHHLNKIRKKLHKDILVGIYTIPQLESKYGTSKATILRERRKLMK